MTPISPFLELERKGGFLLLTSPHKVWTARGEDTGRCLRGAGREESVAFPPSTACRLQWLGEQQRCLYEISVGHSFNHPGFAHLLHLLSCICRCVCTHTICSHSTCTCFTSQLRLAFPFQQLSCAKPDCPLPGLPPPPRKALPSPSSPAPTRVCCFNQTCVQGFLSPSHTLP